MGIYDVGDLVRVSAAFATVGSATDPQNVTAKYRTPSGTITTLTYGTDAELVKDSAGNYHVDISVTEAGDWHYRFAGTGTGQSAGEGTFRVSFSKFS